MPESKTWPCEPETIWAATTPTDAPPRPNPPDVRPVEEFNQRVAFGNSAWVSAGILGCSGLFFLAMAVAALAFRPESSGTEEDGFIAVLEVVYRWFWVAPGLAAIWFLVSALRAFRTESRQHPTETSELHKAHLDRGITVEVSATRFRIHDASEGTVPADIGVDVRLNAYQAERIRQVFHSWFDELRADKTAARHMRDELGPQAVQPAAEFFGPEAAGGYLIRQMYAPERFLLLIPDPPNSSEKWARLRIRNPRR